MALIVHKYGGTSMGSTERIRNVARRVAKWARAGHQMVVVPSAMSGETNRLLGLANELSPEAVTPELTREMDVIAATGEQVSVGAARDRAAGRGRQAVSYARLPGEDPHRPRLHQGAHHDDRRPPRARGRWTPARSVVIAGFQGVDEHGNITTLGRGGSDTSAVAVAAAIKAAECEIYTDVDGVYTTDPSIVPEARRLSTISYEEMLELACLGLEGAADPLGRVRRQVPGAAARAVELHALGHRSRPGGEVGHPDRFEEDALEQAVVSGMAFNRDEAKISLLGVPDQPGIAYQILGPWPRPTSTST